MTDPAGVLAARIERFQQAADPELIWDPAALAEAEQAMRACAGDRSDAATWRLIGILHLARHRLDQHSAHDAAVAGAFFAAVAVADPGQLPEKLRGAGAPHGDSADTWAGLVEEVFRHVDPAAYPHVGLLIHALVRRAMAHPTAEASDRLGQFLLQEAMRSPGPEWAPGALEHLGSGLVRLYGLTREPEVLDDAVHVLFRAALAGPGEAAHTRELASALGLAAPDDDELAKAYLAAAEAPPAGQDRSQALLALVELTRARASASYADEDLLAFIRVGQCALDFWHERWAHPGVLAPYAAGLVEWFVVTGNRHSLEAGTEMLEALRVTPDETARGPGEDPAVRLGLLGDRRWKRYGATGDPADLETAVEVMREAAATAPRGHPERPRLLTNLANALLRRAVVTGGDPAQPIAAARAALAVHGERDQARAGVLMLLGQALKLDLTAEHADEAVAALREALETEERPASRAQAYGLVSEVLRRRGTRPGGRASDLHEAVAAARQGVELVAKGSDGQASARRALCTALLARFSALDDPRDLAETLTLADDDDADLLARLGAVLDRALPLPLDEPLAQAATDLAVRTRDEDMALKLLRYAERQASSSGDYLLDVALRLAELGRLAAASGVLERAAASFEAAGEHSRAADTLSRQGAGLEKMGEYERALEAYGRSAAVHRELGEHRAEALRLGSMGVIHLKTGDPARAVEHHLRAIALCERAGLAAEEAAAQGQAAEAYLAVGDPAGAVACAVRARELHGTLGQSQEAAAALAYAARAAVDQGDLTASAERIAACAIELEAAGAWEAACRALDAHTVLLAGRGHRTQAAACETRLVEIVRRRGERREPADEWFRIARRYRERGDTRGARAAFELAEREYEAISDHDGAGIVRHNLGVLAYTGGSAEAALEEFGAAAETFLRLREPAKEAAALTMRATCLTGLGRHDDALADLERAAELAAAAGDLEALLTATLGRAALDVALGEPQEALERLYTALELAGGDPLKEAVVCDRLAGLAARTGDQTARVEALERAVTGFRAARQDRLAALAAVKLGFALEECGEFGRARAALEQGLAGLEPGGGSPGAAVPPQGAPFEMIATMADSLDAEVLARLAAIQLTIGDLTLGHATLTQALTTLRTGGGTTEEAERWERRLLLTEAEAAGDLIGARAAAEHALNAAEQARPQPLATDRAHAGQVSTDDRAHAGQVSTDDRAHAGQVSTDDRAHARQSPEDDRSFLLARLAAYCLALGEPAAAHDYAARGRELRDDRLIEHLRNLGSAFRRLGRVPEAIGVLGEAVERARGAGDALPVQLAQALDALGLALADQARWSESAQAFEEALTLLDAPVWRSLRAPILADRAALHLTLGELGEASARYRSALSVKEELGERTGLADGYADLAMAHMLRGEPDLARPLAEHALALARGDGDGHGAILHLIMLARLEGPVRAETHLAEALALAQEWRFPAGEAIALSCLGALDVAEAACVRATRRLSRAIELLEELGHELELRAAYELRSVAAEELGDLEGALADAERSCALGHVAAHDRAVGLAVRLGRGLTAWTHAEHAKSHAMTAWPHPSAPSGVPADLLDAERRGLDAVHTLMSAAHHTRDPLRATALIRRAHTVRAELETIWARMEPLAPLGRPTPFTQGDLDALVTPSGGREAAVGLLGFHVGEEGVTVLAHRTGWPEPRAFATTVDHETLAAFAETIGGQRPGLLDIAARRHRLTLWRRLADTLLKEASDALGDDLGLLYLLPHRALHRVPLHALAPGGRLLLERFPIAYAHSAAALLRLSRRGPAGSRSLALGFTQDTSEIPAVEATTAEAAELLGVQPHTGQEATAALLPGAWDVIHLSCHGVYDRADPFASGIRLADGLLTARRLMTMTVEAGLLILGACEDGPPGGNDVSALAHALLNVGVRAALLTLWPVSAEVTRALMRDLHTRLHAGEDPALALRAAVLELRELYGSAEPDLWAAYVLVGLRGR
ncbi:CHAT domain-containing protein [Nonomuraea sp. NPDC046802]|uniref:CHAT domain-containing protein n=1 Tax=Nonomuraea sp. NPDC046802 TaxID=3154919 RepID=UPI0033F2A50D